jgi:hypothetical protein
VLSGEFDRGRTARLEIRTGSKPKRAHRSGRREIRFVRGSAVRKMGSGGERCVSGASFSRIDCDEISIEFRKTRLFYMSQWGIIGMKSIGRSVARPDAVTSHRSPHWRFQTLNFTDNHLVVGGSTISRESKAQPCSTAEDTI